MSHERTGGRVTFQCDTCPEAAETDTGDFNEALAEVKSDGWQAYPVRGVWCHACPACKRSR